MKITTPVATPTCSKLVAGRFGAVGGKGLPILLLLLALPAAARAQFKYTTADGQVTITQYDCSGDTVTIPTTINGLPVTRIGNGAFQYCSSMTSITIPDSVTSIGDSAFSDCTSLISVTIPSSVTSIGEAAFASCTSLTGITVESLNPTYSSSDGVLFNKSQTTLILYPARKAGSYAIPDSVTSVGIDAFSYCTRLTSVTIPNSVTSIGDGPFFRCTNLSAITVEALNSIYSSVAGVLFDKSQATLIQCPPGKAGSYTIPNSVIRIGARAFFDCASLTSVTIPSSVTSIGDGAFYVCSGLASVTIPDSVISIGDSAFSDCISLTSVTIPNSVTSIGDKAFAYCANLVSITFGNSVTRIGEQPFFSCPNLTEMTVEALNPIYSSVAGVLFNKSQTTLILCPEGKAGSYTIPNGVTVIGDRAFWICYGLTGVTIPESVIRIGDSAFADCNGLTSVTIPNGVTSIGNGAFSSCRSLTSVTIANSVTSIGYEAFGLCLRLTEMTVEALNPTYSSVAGVLFNKSQTTLILYPEGKAGSYTIPNTVTSIGEAAFRNCTSLTGVTIPNRVTSIGHYAFDLCTHLSLVELPNSVTSIGEAAFGDCTRLTRVYFQGNAPTVDPFAFFSSEKATLYYLPGTMGWSSTFAGRPTRLWTFGILLNQFVFTINWPNQSVVVVEASADAEHPVWTPVGTNTLTDGLSYFSDPQWTNYPAHFYRLRLP